MVSMPALEMRTAVLAAAILGSALAVLAAPVRAGEAARARPVVVELFTSQGCSSCPPAERYLNELARRADVLPLSFHVTYWNALGWRDPFSFEAATQRQGAYAARLGGGSYTPELVVDGRRQAVGSDRDAVEALIRQARAEQSAAAPAHPHPAPNGEAVPVTVARRGDALAITLGAGPKPSAKVRVLIVGFDRQRSTAVGRGENGGRTLIQSNVVRSLRAVGFYDGAPLALDEPAGAGEEAAVILQGGDGRILGVGRG